jgi:serpin B
MHVLIQFFLVLAFSQIFSPDLLEAASAPNAKNPEVDVFIPQLNTFTFQLYAQMKDEKTNVVISPYLLSASMASVYAGAEFSTQTQIGRTLRYQSLPAEMTSIFALLNEKLMIYTPVGFTDPNFQGYQALWFPRGTKIFPAYEKEIVPLKAVLRFTDLGTRPDAARTEINSWLRAKSQGKLEDLLVSREFTVDSQPLLSMGVFFRGKWERAFDPQRTAYRSFFPDNSTTISVPTVHTSGMYPVVIDENFTVVELAYDSPKAHFPKPVMWLIIPRDLHDSRGIETGFTADKFMKWKNQMQSQLIELAVPQFKLSTSIDFKEAMQKMGLMIPFTEDADFSGISSIKGMRFTHLVQRAQLSFDEKGADAGLLTERYSPSSYNPREIPLKISADHPFAFLIYDKATDIILLIGRVVNP